MPGPQAGLSLAWDLDPSKKPPGYAFQSSLTICPYLAAALPLLSGSFQPWGSSPSCPWILSGSELLSHHTWPYLQDEVQVQIPFLPKAFPDSFNSSLCVCAKSLSRVWLCATPWTIAPQAPLSVEFSRQEYWSGLPFPPPGDLPNPGFKPESPTLQADSLPLSHLESPSQIVVLANFCGVNNPTMGKFSNYRHMSECAVRYRVG